jgi:hypothetical protein
MTDFRSFGLAQDKFRFQIGEIQTKAKVATTGEP